jgi:hypothetical protein
MKNRVLFSVMGTLVLVCGLVALGVYVYNLGAVSAMEEGVDLPMFVHYKGHFPSIFGVIFGFIGLMILIKITFRMIMFPLLGAGPMGARKRWRGYGPWHWHPMNWEDDVPAPVRSWHRRMHEMDEDEESPVEE